MKISNANYIFTEIFVSFWQRVAIIENFRYFALSNLPTAIANAQKRQNNLMHQLIHEPEYQKYVNQEQFKKLIKDPEEFKRLNNNLINNQINDFQVVIDFSSIVFMHNLVDTAVLDYLNLTAEIDTETWTKEIRSQKVDISDLLESTVKDVILKKIKMKIEGLSKESLLSKLDFLHRICPPPADFNSIRDFKYERDRIVALDKLRHKNVHGKASLSKLPMGEQDLFFLKQTFLYIGSLVAETYGLQVDTEDYKQIILKE